MRHSVGFVEVVLEETGDLLDEPTLVDLGSGGGVPGLVLASYLPGWSVVLVDASLRRCRFLEWAVEELGFSERMRVEHGRAEDLARGRMRGTCDILTARAFGPPGVTAECARGFLVPHGVAVVSDPPTDHERWPIDALSGLGYGPPGHVAGAGHRFTVLRASGACPEGTPRRPGVPGRRPLF